MSWPQVRLKHLMREVDELTENAELPLMSVSIHLGVVRRDSLTSDEARADDLGRYKRVEPGDVVLNRMRAFQGGIGRAREAGIVSPDYAVLRLDPELDGRYFHHLFRSSWFVGEMASRLRGIGGLDQGNVRTPRINVADLGEIVIAVPPPDEQREIADFLDADTARIDALIAKSRALLGRLDERQETEIYLAVTGRLRPANRRTVKVDWIASLPSHWGLSALGADYEVQLGKMLSPAAVEGSEAFPYLRNSNVQWDRVVLDDLKEMSFDPEERHRLRLKPGDLLVCEGGDVGRAAVWNGELDDCYFQKAIHRVRLRGTGNPRFLMYCLRAASHQGVFTIEGNQSTIVHLTAEQLRVHRFPRPPVKEQDEIVRQLDESASCTATVSDRLNRQINLLREHRDALVTAAVTGQLDVAKAAA